MLRIIAGEFRSRLLETPPDANSARPLPDRVRVALFNMLEGHYEDGAFVDVFAGTGSFGLEAISRGAERCVFIERDREVGAMLARNIEMLGAGDRATLIRADALGPAALASAPRPSHVVFFDPPYPMMTDAAKRGRVFEQFRRFVEVLDPAGFAIIRTPWPFVDHEEDPGDPERLVRVDVSLELEGVRGPETHAYGSTALHWYMRPDR
jgi:16S rRNA (guanine(966)-N(2))-methyltransferase RsmD